MPNYNMRARRCPRGLGVNGTVGSHLDVSRPPSSHWTLETSIHFRSTTRANLTCYGTSVLRLKFYWLILLVYRAAWSDFSEVAGERIQDLIGGLGPVNGRGLAFGMS